MTGGSVGSREASDEGAERAVVSRRPMSGDAERRLLDVRRAYYPLWKRHASERRRRDA